MQEFNKYVMYSGGAYGSDYIWGTKALNYGILEKKNFHYYIKGNKTPFGNQPIILNEKIIKKIDDDLKIVNEKFKDELVRTASSQMIVVIKKEKSMRIIE